MSSNLVELGGITDLAPASQPQTPTPAPAPQTPRLKNHSGQPALATNAAAPSRASGRAIGKVVPSGPRKVATVEGITEYRLHNGLRVLLLPDPSEATITVNITYLVGSRHEGYGETGMAHLLEHLDFKGTPTHRDIPAELTAHGAKANGTTWLDRTNYWETFPASSDNLTWALDLEASRMLHSFIAKRDLDSEMTVVRNELEMGENDPQRALNELLHATAYRYHNYGKSTIGARSDVENVRIPRLKAFYQKYYQPDNAVLVVAGRFEPEQALQLIEQKFGRMQRPSRRLEPTYTREPVQEGAREVRLERAGEVPMIGALYHTPAGAHVDAAAVEVLASMLFDEPAGRVYQALVEAKLAARVEGGAEAFREGGHLTAQVEVRKGDSVEAAKQALVDTLERAGQTPFTAVEVERAKKHILNGYEARSKVSSRLAIGLSESIALGDWRLYFLMRDRIAAVTPEDVQRAARAYLKESNRTLGVFVPKSDVDRAVIPLPPDPRAALRGYAGRSQVNMSAGEQFDPTPANVEARAVRLRTRAGLNVTMLPKRTRGESVRLQLSLRTGDAESLTGRGAVPQLWLAMLGRATSQHGRQELQDALSALKAEVGIGGSGANPTVNVRTERANLPAVLKLLREILGEPRFEAREFESLKAEMTASLAQQIGEPDSEAMTAYARHMAPYPSDHPRYRASAAETIARIEAATLDQVESFHRQIMGASAGELTVVGDFDASTLGRDIDAAFGDFVSPRATVRVPHTARPEAPGHVDIDTPQKENAFFVTGLQTSLKDTDPDYPAMLLGDFILGGGFLSSRLARRVRQQEGLSYTVASQLQVNSQDGVAEIMAYAICAPQNLARVERAIKEELQRVVSDGFTDREIAEAKQAWLSQRQVARADDGVLASSLNHAAYTGRTLAFSAELEAKVMALTAQQVGEAWRRHLDVSQLTVVEAGDLSKKNT